MTFASRHQRGFTLIELLVVIAIIGLLSSVVLASLNGARQRGRDARRLADLKQLQVALELSYSDNNTYPANLASLATANYIPAIPTDPAGSGSYTYAVSSSGNYYCIGATLESANSIPEPADICDGSGQGGGMTEPTGNYRVGP
jgi:general secretion pathway protein G